MNGFIQSEDHLLFQQLQELQLRASDFGHDNQNTPLPSLANPSQMISSHSLPSQDHCQMEMEGQPPAKKTKRKWFLVNHVDVQEAYRFFLREAWKAFGNDIEGEDPQPRQWVLEIREILREIERLFPLPDTELIHIGRLIDKEVALKDKVVEYYEVHYGR